MCGAEYEQDTLFCPRDGTPLGSSRNQPGEDPYIGLVVADQIEIRQLIGIGSMGRVYRAWQRGVERDVAVKLLHRELSANPSIIARFLREARISSRLQHPNVVQVLMAGQLPSSTSNAAIGGELHIVMEYLDGISLMSALAACNGVMPLPRALHLVLQICDAVGEAHAQGIVHRDVKPENVMLVRRGDDPDFAKVLDFGIARLDWGQGSVATQAGLIFGTARYISPEGAMGDPVGPQADVYSIATILYQSLSGRTPFEHDAPMTLLMMHSYEPPPPIQSIARASYLPAPLATAIMRNLGKHPGERAPDARSFGRDLVNAARASGMSPDDLVPRSTLLGQRVTSASAFTSLEPTNKLELSPRVAKIIGAYGTRPSDPATEFSAPQVEPTMDDASATPPAVSPETAASASILLAPPAPLPTAHGTSRTLDDDDGEHATRRARIRSMVVVVACFLGGAGLVVIGARHLGYLGGATELSEGSIVQRAEDALRAKRFVSPPGDNVRDLTNEGLRLHPTDAALADVRRRAAQELVTSSLGMKYAGDLVAALEQALLALELAPDNTTAQHLVEELQAASAARPPIEVTDTVASARAQDASAPLGTATRLVPGAGHTAGADRHGGAVPTATETVPAPVPTASHGRWL